MAFRRLVFAATLFALGSTATALQLQGNVQLGTQFPEFGQSIYIDYTSDDASVRLTSVQVDLTPAACDVSYDPDGFLGTSDIGVGTFNYDIVPARGTAGNFTSFTVNLTGFDSGERVILALELDKPSLANSGIPFGNDFIGCQATLTFSNGSSFGTTLNTNGEIITVAPPTSSPTQCFALSGQTFTSDPNSCGIATYNQLICNDLDGDGVTDCDGDCDDNDPNEFPGQVWYKDTDNDGISDGTTSATCERPAGFKFAAELSATSGDCDDNDPLLGACNTPAGPNPVTIADPGGRADITFEGVAQPGETTVSEIPCTADVPDGFTLNSEAVCFDIQTTAESTTGEKVVCLRWPETLTPAPTAILKCDSAGFNNCCIVPFNGQPGPPCPSVPPPTLESFLPTPPAGPEVCIRTESLSAFALGIDANSTDTDFDTFVDAIDNCPTVFNPSQSDDDADGLGDACDPFPGDTDNDGLANTVDPDDDNDGMPDTWEQDNGLNSLDASDASSDADGDGFTALEEFQNGTDPNVADAPASNVQVPALPTVFACLLAVLLLVVARLRATPERR